MPLDKLKFIDDCEKILDNPVDDTELLAERWSNVYYEYMSKNTYQSTTIDKAKEAFKTQFKLVSFEGMSQFPLCFHIFIEEYCLGDMAGFLGVPIPSPPILVPVYAVSMLQTETNRPTAEVFGEVIHTWTLTGQSIHKSGAILKWL